MHRMAVPMRAAVVALGVGSIFAAACLPARAQITKAGDGYTFRMKFTKGTALAYQMISETPKPINSFDPKRTEVPFVMNILDVKNGVATIRLDSGPAVLDGKPRQGKNSVEVTMDSRGKVVNGAPGAMQFGGVNFPQKPLKVGESFQTETSNQVPTASGMKKLTIKSRVTFAGIKKVRNKDVAELKVEVSASGLVPTLGTGTQYLDITDGQLLAARLDQKARAMANGMEVIVENTMRIFRTNMK